MSTAVFVTMMLTDYGTTDSLKAENSRLRNALLVMVTDRKKMASQLTGVQNLGLQLQRKEQEKKSLLEKNERLEGSLARAENRITQLSLLAGNGQQTVASQGAIVTPGVSKKVLEALTRENTKLRQALDHLTNKGPSGVDLTVVCIEKMLYFKDNFREFVYRGKSAFVITRRSKHQ